MLSINKIKLENFVTYESEVLDFESYFARDRLLLISGENNDAPFICNSNGAGKSLIYEALCWAVFDRTTRGGLKDNVVGRFAGGCSVFATITNITTGDIYEIRRYRKHKNHGNNVFFFINGEEQKFTIKTDVNKFIWHMLGISYDKVINTCIFRSDDERKRFVYMGDVDRKRLLAEMRGTDIFPLCEKLVVQEHKNAEAELEAVNTVLQDALRQKRQLIHELRNLREQAQAVAKEYEQRSERVRKQKADALVGFQKKQRKLKKRLQTRKRKLDELKAGVGADEVSKEEERHRELEEKVSRAVEDYAVVTTNMARTEKALKNCSSADHVGAICDKCGNRITGWTLRKHIQNLETEMVAFEGKAKAASARVDKARAESMAVLAKMDRLKETKWHIASLKDEIATIREQLQEIKNVYQEKQDALDKELVEIETQANPYDDLVGTHTERMAELTMQIGEQRCKITNLREEIKYLWAWRTGYGREEIQHQALQGTVDKLNESISKISDCITAGSMDISLATEKFGAVKKLGNILDLEITDTKEGKARPFKEFSTGERKRIEIIFSLASLDLDDNIFLELFLDELFDGLDSTGTKRIVRLLEEKAEQGRNIAVITHIPDIGDHFDNVLLVTKKDGRSQVEHRA